MALVVDRTSQFLLCLRTKARLCLCNPRLFQARFHSQPILSRANEIDHDQLHSTLSIPHLTKANESERRKPIKKEHLTDENILKLIKARKLQLHRLEKELQDLDRAVKVRREALVNAGISPSGVEKIPHENYNYEEVHDVCCENVIGYVPLPVGIAGPLRVNGKMVPIPLATTEGCLVASTHRGCKALNASGGVSAIVYNDGMTRAPILRFKSVQQAHEFAQWLSLDSSMKKITEAFESTRRTIHLRFTANTGDAMGMNMISKGVEAALAFMSKTYNNSLEVLSLSGNTCTDKKPSAVNWVEGRGKTVICEAVVPGKIVRNVLKTSVEALVDLNNNKNFIGSALAGSIGGNNAHASNLVTAMFIATGQDVAQNVESSNCMTILESENQGKDLRISCTLPSLEVGTVGGGSQLSAQAGCLEMMGVKGAGKVAGENARQLAMSIGAGVLAGELSLMAALSAGHLVESHMRHNRRRGDSSSIPLETCIIS